MVTSGGTCPIGHAGPNSQLSFCSKSACPKRTCAHLRGKSIMSKCTEVYSVHFNAAKGRQHRVWLFLSVLVSTSYFWTFFFVNKVSETLDDNFGSAQICLHRDGTVVSKVLLDKLVEVEFEIFFWRNRFEWESLKNDILNAFQWKSVPRFNCRATWSVSCGHRFGLEIFLHSIVDGPGNL